LQPAKGGTKLLITNTCDGSDVQKWIINKSEKSIQNKGNGRCMERDEANGVSASGGKTVFLRACDKSKKAAQKFEIRGKHISTFYETDQTEDDEAYCLTVLQLKDAEPVSLFGYTKTKTQEWTFT